eukprot:1149430-Pelagomonas_calceolata.AAC.5
MSCSAIVHPRLRGLCLVEAKQACDSSPCSARGLYHSRIPDCWQTFSIKPANDLSCLAYLSEPPLLGQHEAHRGQVRGFSVRPCPQASRPCPRPSCRTTGLPLGPGSRPSCRTTGLPLGPGSRPSCRTTGLPLDPGSRPSCRTTGLPLDPGSRFRLASRSCSKSGHRSRPASRPLGPEGGRGLHYHV